MTTSSEGIAMNRGTIVRTEATADGLSLKVWVDDDAGRHVVVAMCEIPASHLASWAQEVGEIRARRDQYELDFT